MRPDVAQHALTLVIPGKAGIRPFVIPAQAGIQEVVARNVLLDSRLRGNDGDTP